MTAELLRISTATPAGQVRPRAYVLGAVLGRSGRSDCGIRTGHAPREDAQLGTGCRGSAPEPVDRLTRVGVDYTAVITYTESRFAGVGVHHSAVVADAEGCFASVHVDHPVAAHSELRLTRVRADRPMAVPSLVAHVGSLPGRNDILAPTRKQRLEARVLDLSLVSQPS